MEDSGRVQTLAATATAPAAPAPATVAPPASATLSDGVVAAGGADNWRRLDDNFQQPQRFYRSRVLAEGESVAESARNQQTDPSSGGFRVLDRFVIEQQTNTMRVVDADGSVYEGTVNATAPLDAAGGSGGGEDLVVRQKTLKEAPSSANRGYSFRASGSNVTLRQKIEVSGQFMPGTNAPIVAARGSSGAAAATAPTSRGTVAPSDSRRGGNSVGLNKTNSAVIEGTFRIGTTGEQRFRAVKDAR